MKRVMINYPNGRCTYGYLSDDFEDPHFVFAGKRFEVEDVKATGISVTTSDEDVYTCLKGVGIPVMRPEKQYTITISVQKETQERLKKAAKSENKSVSKILEKLAVEWMDKNKY